MDLTNWPLALVALVPGVLLTFAAARRHRRGRSLTDVLDLLLWVPLSLLLTVLVLLPADSPDPGAEAGPTEPTGAAGLFDLGTVQNQVIAGGLATMALLWLWRRSLRRSDASPRTRR